MILSKRPLAALLVLAVLTAGAAQATSIKSPIVRAGEAEVGIEVEATDDKNSKQAGAAELALNLGYGVTKHWYFRLQSQWARDPGDSLQHNVLGLENRFQILPQDEYLFNLGFYVEYEFGTQENAADELTVGPTLQTDIGDFRFTANPFLSVEVGGGTDAAPEFKYGLRGQYLLHPAFNPGIELHGNTGSVLTGERPSDQTHLLGPVATGNFSAAPLGLSGRFGYEVGVQFGLTKATPDQNYKAKLRYLFAF